MNSVKSNISANLNYLRIRQQRSQEEIAESIGVTRQAVAKWEKGATLPDIIHCILLAELFDISLNDLVCYDPEQIGLPIPPKDKHFFGTVTMNDKRQIRLPKRACNRLAYKAGDTLVVLGDSHTLTAGIALVSSEVFFQLTGQANGDFFKGKRPSDK